MTAIPRVCSCQRLATRHGCPACGSFSALGLEPPTSQPGRWYCRDCCRELAEVAKCTDRALTAPCPTGIRPATGPVPAAVVPRPSGMHARSCRCGECRDWYALEWERDQRAFLTAAEGAVRGRTAGEE